jgi:hypothetical protein
VVTEKIRPSCRLHTKKAEEEDKGDGKESTMAVSFGWEKIIAASVSAREKGREGRSLLLLLLLLRLGR